jgi:hypothetical protein
VVGPQKDKFFTYVDKIGREHGQVLVEEVDAARVDTLGDILADLVRASSVDHVERSPSVLGLGTSRGTDKERVLHLALEVVLLDIVGHSSRNLPIIVEIDLVSALFYGLFCAKLG